MKYKLFVNSAQDNMNPWVDLKQQLYLGSDEFVSKAQSRIGLNEDFIDITKCQIPRNTLPLTIEEYFLITNNRDMAIYQSYKSGKYSMKAIGHFFSLHYSRISRIIKKNYEDEAQSKI